MWSCVCMCYSLSCCSVWRMTKTQPSPWSSVCSSATRRLSVGCTSAANRELSTQWSTTWRQHTTLPSTTSSGSAQAASKVLILSATQLKAETLLKLRNVSQTVIIWSRIVHDIQSYKEIVDSGTKIGWMGHFTGSAVYITTMTNQLLSDADL